MKIKKRFLAMLLTVCLSSVMLPQTAFATEEVTIGTGGLCEHHVTHDETCGYVEGIVGTPCAHEHTEACFKRTESCTHIHTADCYPVMGSAVSDNSAILSDVIELVVCTHECSEESSCITEELNCIHAEHDNECGYIAAVEGDDCHYECTECAAPTCTCEIGVQNRHATNCPVYAAPENPECFCDEKCTEGNIDIWCDICGFDYTAYTREDLDEDSEHIHYVCGGVDICKGHPGDPMEQPSFQHDDNDNKSYTALISMGNTTLSQASYYLPGDLKVSETIIIEEEVNLCLNGRTLELAGGVNGSLFLIKNGGKLTLCDCKGGGKLVGNDVGSSVVTVATNGTFHMYSGTISGAKSTSGGGVCIDGKPSSFTMYGGMISGNTAKNGSGVYLNVGAFTMYDGTIDSNTAENGGVYVAGGQFIMEGGTISSNEAEHGGGVYVDTSGIVILRDGATIKENTSNGNGGGVYVAGGEFAMDGGIISSNKAQYGGGVAAVGGISTMNAGIISSNEAQYGGGVAVIGGTFTVDGGTISDNTAANSGGGVYMDSGTNTMFTVGGGEILENKKNSDAASNVYVVGGAPFNVKNSLPSDTIIYVDHGIGAVFTNGGLDENAVKYFSSSDTNLLKVEQRVGDGALEIKLKEDSSPAPHSHASCGVSCEQTDNPHAFVTYEALLTDDEIETGSYYLLADLQVAETITINAPVNLCLNGHELTLKSGLFRIGEGATLTLCDCKGGGRVIGALSNAGDLYVYGGTLAEISLENDGVVYLAEGAKFADNLLKVNFTSSEQIYADPDLLNTQKMALYLDESISTVPDGAVVRAWKADGSDSSFTSTNNFTLVRPVGYLLEPDNGAVVLSSSSGGSTAGVAGGSAGSSSGSRPGSGGNTGGSDGGYTASGSSDATDDSGKNTAPATDDRDDTSSDTLVKETLKSSDTGDNTSNYMTYTVQKGDTLWAIIKKYGCTVSEIMAANSDLIKDSDLIYPGWQLKIPQGEATDEDTRTDFILSEDKRADVYIVNQGDTLWAISKKYGCTIAEIVSLNGELITDPDLIYIGWKIKVPQD